MTFPAAVGLTQPALRLLAKTARSQPTVMTADQPLNHVSVPTATVMDQKSVYLPMVQR